MATIDASSNMFRNLPRPQAPAADTVKTVAIVTTGVVAYATVVPALGALVNRWGEVVLDTVGL